MKFFFGVKLLNLSQSAYLTSLIFRIHPYHERCRVIFIRRADDLRKMNISKSEDTDEPLAAKV